MPDDCTCGYPHEDGVESAIPDASIAILIDLADCPAEKRALRRILASRW